MTDLPAGAVPIIDWPEYAITPDGQVWRVAPSPYADGRRGPVPRRLKPLMMGSANGKKSPAVKLSRGSYTTAARTIRSLVRQHFGA